MGSELQYLRTAIDKLTSIIVGRRVRHDEATLLTNENGNIYLPTPQTKQNPSDNITLQYDKNMTTPQQNVETFTSMIKNITDYDDETLPEQNCDTECVENVTLEKNENVTPHYDEEILPQNDNQYQYMIKDYHEAAAQNNENLAKQCNENLTPQYNKPNIQVSQHNITAQNNVFKTPQAYAMPIVYERPFNRPMFGNQYSSTTFSPSRGCIAPVRYFFCEQA